MRKTPRRGPSGRRVHASQTCQRARGATWAKKNAHAEDGRRLLHCGGSAAPAGYKEPTGDFTPPNECSNVFEAAGATRGGGTTQQDLEKVAIRRWTSDASTVTKTNRALQTRPTVEALRSSLLPYNRRRREGAAEAGAEAGARGGGRRSPGRALKQARAVKTGQVQRHAQVAAGTREGGGGISGTVRQPTWTPQAKFPHPLQPAQWAAC